MILIEPRGEAQILCMVRWNKETESYDMQTLTGDGSGNAQVQYLSMRPGDTLELKYDLRFMAVTGS